MTTTNNPPIGLLLRTLDRAIDERFERTLGARDITRRQWQLLSTLAAHAASVEELDTAVAPFLDQEAGETTRQHLEPLAGRGAVVAHGDVYELSAQGRTLFEHLSADVQVTRSLVVRGLAEGEYERTVATLRTMIDNLESSR